MKTIHKYALIATGVQVITMPNNSEILTVQTQNGVPCIWALVDTDNSPEERVFYIFGTGQEVGDAILNMIYIGTFQMENSGLVFHLFERK